MTFARCRLEVTICSIRNWVKSWPGAGLGVPAAPWGGPVAGRLWASLPTAGAAGGAVCCCCCGRGGGGGGL